MENLQLGLVKSQELAKWFGISYDNFRHYKERYLDLLDFYCEYEEVYGGINIIKIFNPVYNRRFKPDFENLYLSAIFELKDNHDRIVCSNLTIALYMREHYDLCANLQVNTIARKIPYYTEKYFGKPISVKDWSEGIAGRSRKIYVKIVEKGKKYIPLDLEEIATYKKIFKEGSYTEEIFNAQQEYYENGECTEEELEERVKAIRRKMFSEIRNQIQETFKCQITRVSLLELMESCATKEEFLKLFNFNQLRRH